MTVSRTGPPLEASDVDTAVDLVRARGLRVSAARRLVIEALFSADRPVSAEHIAGGLEGRMTRSDLASVYRNLETLEELGLVRHFHLGHGPGLYALAGADDREHIVCDSCGAVRAEEPEALEDIRDLIRRRFGYQARFTHFPIVGLCPECQDAPAPDASPETRSARVRTR